MTPTEARITILANKVDTLTNMLVAQAEQIEYLHQKVDAQNRVIENFKRTKDDGK